MSVVDETREIAAESSIAVAAGIADVQSLPAGHHRRIIEPTSGWQPVNLRELWGYRDLLLLLALRDLKSSLQTDCARADLDNTPANHYHGAVHVDFRTISEHQYRLVALSRLLFLGGPILGFVFAHYYFEHRDIGRQRRNDSEDLLSSAHFGAFANPLGFRRFQRRLFAVGNSDA